MRDRLDPKTFEADEPVGFASVDLTLLPGPLPADRWNYLPQRLWHRLLKLGEAYELHFASVVEPVIDTVFMPEQSEAMAAELQFLLDVVNDSAFQQAISPLLSAARDAASRPHHRLVLSPP